MGGNSRPKGTGCDEEPGQEPTQDENGQEGGRVGMAESEDRRTYHSGSSPAPSGNEALENKAPEENLLHRWGHQ